MLTNHPPAENEPGQDQYGPALPYLTAPNKVLQLDVFGGFLVHQTHTEISPDLLALPVAPHACPECCEYPNVYDRDGNWTATDYSHLVPKMTTPVPLSDPALPWNPYPCHLSECDCCYGVGVKCDTCDRIEEHCNCTYCTQCEELEEDCTCNTCQSCGEKDYYGDNTCGRCDRCESCCNCMRGGRPSSRKLTPGWVTRGESAYSYTGDAEDDFHREYGARIDPAQAMCDFYLTDYVLATTKAQGNVTSYHGTWADETGAYAGTWTSTYYGIDNYRPNVQARRDAYRIQKGIVTQLSEAFAEYAFMAIGGEVRYHGNAGNDMPVSGRSSVWAWWREMGNTHDLAQLTRDCAELFRDPNEAQFLGDGYGGEKWAIAADILAAYYEGTLDARTFVDRMFSLQHNGGSFLNKASWKCLNDAYYGTSDMMRIGNAHAATQIDFFTLLSGASDDVRHLILSTAPALKVKHPNDYNAISAWVSHYRTPDNFREEYAHLLPDTATATPTADPELERLLAEEEAIEAEILKQPF